MKQILKILLVISIFTLILAKKAYADEFLLERSKYDNIYAVYDAPDRVRLFDAEQFIIDGKTAYCIEPGTPIHSNWYQNTEDWEVTGFDKDLMEDIKLIAYYGYNYNSNQTTRNYYLATQELIWKRIANREVYWIEGTNVNGPRVDITGEKARINYLVENHKKLPSFSGQTYKMRAGEEATIWDMNYVLSNYEIYETTMPNAHIDNEYLKLKATNPHETGSIKFVRKSEITNPTLIYFNGENQKLLTVGSLEPIYAELKTEVVVYPEIKVNKIDAETKENIKRAGIKFKIKNLSSNKYACYPSNNCEFETNGDGIMISPMELNYGVYQIEEVANQNIPGYLWNSEPLKFTIDDDSNYHLEGTDAYIELNFANKPVKGKIIVNKVGEEMSIIDNEIVYHEIPLDNVEFKLYSGNELIKTFKTNEGKYIIDNLKLGNYCLKEVSTNSNYKLLSEPSCFELNYQNESTPVVTHEITIKNSLIKGTFMLTKLASDTSKPLPGAEFAIYDELDNLLLVRTTDESGKITIENLPKGKYYYLETTAPSGYLENQTKEYFEIMEDGEIIKAYFVNEKIKIPDTKKNSTKPLKTIAKLLLKILMVLYAS